MIPSKGINIGHVNFHRFEKTSPYNKKIIPPFFFIAHSIHGGFHGNCFQNKAVRISSLPLESEFNINILIVSSSIMATNSMSEMTTTN